MLINFNSFIKSAKQIISNGIKYQSFASVIFRRKASNTALNVDTNVIKDVILYKYENPRYFRLMNVFGVTQFSFWTYLSYVAYSTLKDAPVVHNENGKWWELINLGENKYRNGITISCGLLGLGILTIVWLYSLRSVRYLILRKGGNQLTIVTYTPVATNRMFTLNLNNVSSLDTRTDAKTHIALKVKGHYFYYIVDMKGEFKNPTLFDNTAGLKRNLKSKKVY